VEDFCFDKQVKFIRDPSKFKTAVCSRRAGKTVSCAAHMIEVITTVKNSICLYITLSRSNAKKIIWRDLLAINDEFQLGLVPSIGELSLTCPDTGGVIYLTGAKDSSEIEKFRGLAITLAYIDEAQSFKQYIKDLIDDVLSKALYDFDGTLCLTGTPAPVQAGYFYETTKNKNWAHHHWTMFDNPHLEKKSGKTAMELLQRDLQTRGVTIDDPTIRRENFGEWAVDLNTLVFKYNQALCDFETLPQGQKWNYVIGVDVGFDDADAIAVIAWSDKRPEAYLVEEHVMAKQGITELGEKIQALIDIYDPMKVVMDTGGLGKKIAEELRKRMGLPIVAAEKTRKFEFIELLNDAMRTGRLKARATGDFAQDTYLIEWEDGKQLQKISDRYHSDIADAVLYAFREALHYLHTPEIEKPTPNSEAWFKQQEQELEDEAERVYHESINESFEREFERYG
jgi:phage terminase large subunit